MSRWVLEKLNLILGIICVIAFFCVVTFAGNVEVKDLDLWLHLATGKHILQTFTIPQVDFLSCTIAGNPWNNHEWLFQIIVYTLYSVFGIEGLITFQAFMAVAIFGVLFLAGYNRKGMACSMGVLLLTLFVVTHRLTHRPDLFSMLFLVIYIVLMFFRLDKRSTIIWLGLIQILWTNIHGYFIFGPALVLIAIIAEWLKRKWTLPFEWSKVGRVTDEEFKNLKILGLTVAACCLLNPQFIEGALYPLKVLFSVSGESKVFFAHILELQNPVDWSNIFKTSRNFFPHYKILILISALGFAINYKRIDIRAFVVWCIFLALSLNASRNVALFAIIAYLTWLLNFKSIQWNEIFAPALSENLSLKLFGSSVLYIVLMFNMNSYFSSQLLHGYFDFDKFERKSEYGGTSLRNYPFKAVDFLENNHVKGKFFNDFNSGAYLLGRLSPDIEVFIDGRTEVYGSDFFNDYTKIWKKGDGALFDVYSEKHNLTGAFLNSVYVPVAKDLIRHFYDNENWVLVYFDYDATIFLKDIPQNQPMIRKYAIDLSKRITVPIDLLEVGLRNIPAYQYLSRAQVLMNLRLYDQAKAEVLQALRLSYSDSRAYYILGRINIENGEYELAYENLRKAKLLSSDIMEIRYYLSWALYHMEKYDLALEQAQVALSKAPGHPKVIYLFAQIYAKQKKYELMSKILTNNSLKSKNHIESFEKIAVVLEEDKQWDLAKELYGYILEFDPENSNAQRSLKHLQTLVE